MSFVCEVIYGPTEQFCDRVSVALFGSRNVCPGLDWRLFYTGAGPQTDTFLLQFITTLSRVTHVSRVSAQQRISIQINNMTEQIFYFLNQKHFCTKQNNIHSELAGVQQRVFQFWLKLRTSGVAN